MKEYDGYGEGRGVTILNQPLKWRMHIPRPPACPFGLCEGEDNPMGPGGSARTGELLPQMRLAFVSHDSLFVSGLGSLGQMVVRFFVLFCFKTKFQILLGRFCKPPSSYHSLLLPL